MKRFGMILAGVAVMLACAATQARAGDMRFPVRLSYLDSIAEIADWHDEHVANSEVDVVIPVGLSFAPYYQFDFGLFVWGDLGPIIVMIGDVEYWSVPVSVGAGFTILPRASVSPYVKAGVRFPIADGDYVDSTSAGLYAATGVEFMRRRAVSILLEVGYDASTVTLGEGDGWWRDWEDDNEIEGGFTASIGAVF